MSYRAAAARFGTAASTPIKWLQQFRRTCSDAPRARSAAKRSPRFEADATEFLVLIEQTPDVKHAEVVDHLQQPHAIDVAPREIQRLPDRQGQSFKKTWLASAQQQPDAWQQRLSCLEAQPDLDSEHLILIDATVAATSVGPLRQSGMSAPMVLVGPMSGPAFQARVEQVLAPTLPPGDIVILDKPAHELATVRRAIEAMGGERCFLPPRSPDLKPLEMVRGQLEAGLENVATGTTDDVSNAIGDAIQRLTPQEDRNDFLAAGYGGE